MPEVQKYTKKAASKKEKQEKKKKAISKWREEKRPQKSPNACSEQVEVVK